MKQNTNFNFSMTIKRVKSASSMKDGFGGFVRHCSFNSCRLSAIREPDCVMTMRKETCSLKLTKIILWISTRTLIQMLRSDWLRYIAHYQLLICRSCRSTILRRFPEVLEEHLQRQQITNFRKRLKERRSRVSWVFEKTNGRGHRTENFKIHFTKNSTTTTINILL